MRIRWMKDLEVMTPLKILIPATLILAVSVPIEFDTDVKFWLFSTITQSIAALFGFIFAGYSFYRSETNLDQVSDDEADEILNRLHSRAHTYLLNTSIPAFIAITGGFFTLWLAKTQVRICGLQFITPSLATFVFYQSILAVVFSILFVLYISSPTRTQRVVKEILQEESYEEGNIEVGEFTEKFIKLENLLRKIYTEKGGTEEKISAGQMIHYLAEEKELEPSEIDRLMEINRYRNLVVHGEIESVDEDAYNELEDLIENLEVKVENYES